MTATIPDEAAIKAMLDKDIGNVEAYYNQLLEIAGGNRDFALKWLQKEYQTALGTNDANRTAFLAKVASKDEETNGRIPYDYEKYTTRQLEDYKTGTEGIDRVKKRLQEDYDTTLQGKTIDWNDSRQTQSESLIADRLMSGTREQTLSEGGIAGQRAQKLETAIGQEKKTLDTSLARGLEDQTVAQTALDIENQRKLADLKDEYRRAALDEIAAKEKGTESANLTYSNTKKQINAEKNKEISSLKNQYTTVFGTES